MEAERTRNTNRALQTEIADVRREAKRASEIAVEESEKALKLSKMIEESSSSLEKIAELEAEKQVLGEWRVCVGVAFAGEGRGERHSEGG